MVDTPPPHEADIGEMRRLNSLLIRALKALGDEGQPILHAASPPRPGARSARSIRKKPRSSVGDAVILVNDHDPKPLYYQFEAEKPGRFGWEYVEAGPEVWRVRITRRKAA